jgi:hypothetical protein
MLYTGSSLDKAREVFAAAIYHRPRIRLTIRQRTQVLEQWQVSARAGQTVSSQESKEGVGSGFCSPFRESSVARSW